MRILHIKPTINGFERPYFTFRDIHTTRNLFNINTINFTKDDDNNKHIQDSRKNKTKIDFQMENNIHLKQKKNQ